MNPRSKSTSNVRLYVQLALLMAIELVLAFTPLGYIPLGPVRATTIHIPVILGGILLGPGAGAFLGGVFGLTSFIINTINPTLTSFVFTPFYSLPGGAGGSPWSLVICFIPRILIGVVAYYVYQGMKTITKSPKNPLPLCIAGLAGSITNTVLVMGGIYVFFGKEYALATGRDFATLFNYILTTVIGVNGILEAVIASLLTLFVGRILVVVQKKTQ